MLARHVRTLLVVTMPLPRLRRVASITRHPTRLGPRQEIDARVAALVDRAVRAKAQNEQQAAFDELLTLGCAAVPAIIGRMDDRRKLPIAYIRLDNKSPAAFEAFRQYGPEEVVDALAAVLNQLTGMHFEFIYNGATDDLRARSVVQWREFLARTPADMLCNRG
jgi:hypothetical protein